tara:strand:+ start:931 stop:1170 length:240 start_codon:yes stop_codon:yes gene_type:complete
MIVALTSSRNFKSKLVSILDTAQEKGENGIVVLTDRSWHMKIFDYMNDMKSVGKLKLAGQTFFIIKEMRIELKPIDFYV